MPRLPSASSVWRALNCPASCVLQEVGLIVGDAARFGTEVHRFLELVPQIGVDKALLAVLSENRPFCSSIPLDKLPVAPGKFDQEVAFALDVDTGTAVKVGTGIGRNYPKIYAHQINGTADVLSQLRPRKGYVADYKTGSEFNVPPPAENPQLLTLGLSAASYFGWEEVVAEIHYIRDGSVFSKSATYNRLDLDAHLSTLRRLEASVRTMSPVNPAMSEGPWCHWCASFSVCPAKTKLASAMIMGEDPKLTLRLDEHTAPLIWERLEQAQNIIDAIRTVTESFLSAHPVELPDGRVLGPRESSQVRIVDGNKAWEYMLKKYGSDVAELASTRKVSKEHLREALRGPVEDAKNRGEKVSLVAMERAVMAELRALGAVADVATVKVEAHFPKQ